MAERGGFEPPKPVKVYSLSKRAHSTTMRPLHHENTRNVELGKCRKIWLRYALNGPTIVPLNMIDCRVATWPNFTYSKYMNEEKTLEKTNLFGPPILKALEFAALAHHGQVRKGVREVPYISHPAAVGLILARAGMSSAVVMAGVLHDTVEDTEATEEDIRTEFGEEVAGLVAEVTLDARLPHDEQKKKYLDHIRGASIDAKAISAADKIANLTNVILMHEMGEAVMESVLRRGVEINLAIARARVEAVCENFDHPLAQELQQVLRRYEDVCAQYV